MHYNGPIVRPQTNAYDLFIEVTVGCTHNSCTFCNFYDGFPFRIAPLSQVEADLQEAKILYPHTKKIWASGGNPFALSVRKLTVLASLFKKYFPDAEVSTYARVNDLYQKSVDDIRNLHELGYSNLVLGIESCDDEVLKHVNKGYTVADILRECKKMEAAGMPYRIIYLGGLAGKGKGEESARKTAHILNQLHPYYMFLTTVSILPGTTLYNEVQQGTFQEQTELERIKEFRMLISEMYNPLQVFAETSTNMVGFTASFPKDKAHILFQLDKVIDNFTDYDEATLHLRRSKMTSV